MLDSELMKGAGINTIRVYQPGKYVRNTQEAIRDLYNIFGIRVVIGHWLGFWENPNYADPVFRERIKKDVAVGRYVDISDSFHIYGSYFDDFKNFLKNVSERSFAEKTWSSEFAEPFFEDAREKLKKDRQGA